MVNIFLQLQICAAPSFGKITWAMAYIKLKNLVKTQVCITWIWLHKDFTPLVYGWGNVALRNLVICYPLHNEAKSVLKYPKVASSRPDYYSILDLITFNRKLNYFFVLKTLERPESGQTNPNTQHHESNPCLFLKFMKTNGHPKSTTCSMFIHIP